MAPELHSKRNKNNRKKGEGEGGRGRRGKEGGQEEGRGEKVKERGYEGKKTGTEGRKEGRKDTEDGPLNWSSLGFAIDDEADPEVAHDLAQLLLLGREPSKAKNISQLRRVGYS